MYIHVVNQNETIYSIAQMHGVTENISYMKIHTAAWMEKNCGKCLHMNIKTVPMKNGAAHFVNANTIRIFQKK